SRRSGPRVVARPGVELPGGTTSASGALISRVPGGRIRVIRLDPPWRTIAPSRSPSAQSSPGQRAGMGGTIHHQLPVDGNVLDAIGKLARQVVGRVGTNPV